MSFNPLAENLLREAIRRGEFDDLPGKGKPIDLDGYFALPEDLRAAYMLLKNANCVPEDVAVMNEVARLREVVSRATDPAERDAAAAALREQELRLNVLADRRRAERRK